VSGDLLTAGAGHGLDQVLVLNPPAKGGVVDFDGDDMAGVAQSDLDALTADLGADRGRTWCPAPGRDACSRGHGGGAPRRARRPSLAQRCDCPG
jgi:hypothetical protein